MAATVLNPLPLRLVSTHVPPQVWHCLPAFMSWAVDLPSAYPAAVKSMAAAFNNRPDLHAPICLALQRAASQVRPCVRACLRKRSARMRVVERVLPVVCE